VHAIARGCYPVLDSGAALIGYLAQKCLRAALLLVAVSLLCFALFELSPGDYFDEARLNPQISRDAINALRSEYGLDRPFLTKYAYWIQSVFRGDWGFSLAYGTPAAPILWNRAKNTLVLTVTAMLVAWLIGVPVSVHSASARGVSLSLVRAAVAVLNALPDILIALLLMLIAARSGLFPVGGMSSVDLLPGGAWTKAQDVARHLILPALALSLAALPPIIAHGATAMTQALESPFIKAARAHGIPRWRLLYRHALPVAVNPLISLFGLSIGTLLSSSLLIEAAMGWPGIGRLMLDATLQRDLYLVIGAIMLSSLFLIAGNLLADLLLYAADPRIRNA
jgi:peptide/nickel transport system permease protein